jgi:hypothetical protein
MHNKQETENDKAEDENYEIRKLEAENAPEDCVENDFDKTR